MKKRRRHRHGWACAISRKGKLFCRRTLEELKPLKKKQRACASKIFAEEMHLLKEGRWKSADQAKAVAMSRSRKECR